jgi:hypothetical protein
MWGTVSYLLAFPGHYLQGCAPMATVLNPRLRTASAVQAYLTIGTDLTLLYVSVNKATTAPVDRSFNLFWPCVLPATLRRRLAQRPDAGQVPLQRTPSERPKPGLCAIESSARTMRLAP